MVTETTALSGAPARYEGGLVELADRVHAWIQPNGGLGEANAGLVVGDDASAVIDTCWDHRQARRMLAAMQPLLVGHPIRTVVNTHSNGDHWWGNAVMPADAEIITSEASLAAMDRERPGELSLLASLFSVGRHIPGPFRWYSRYAHEQFSPFAFSQVRLRRPDRTFSGDLTLTVGGRRLDLYEVGPAHTPGDLIVHVADAGVVFAGDVVFLGSTPVMWDGPVSRWIAALDRIIELDAGVVVPGHGPVGSLDDLTALREYWTWLESAASATHARGVPVFSAAVEILESPEFAAAPWAAWSGPERILVNISTIYRNLEGKATNSSPRAVAGVFANTARLAHRVAGSDRSES